MTAACPNCEATFDAVAASTGFGRSRDGRQRVDSACPECGRTWRQLHRETDGGNDPADAEIDYGDAV
jgi:protein-arginine kinase activator protein McsA